MKASLQNISDLTNDQSYCLDMNPLHISGIQGTRQVYG